MKAKDFKKFTPLQWLLVLVILFLVVLFMAGFLKAIFIPVAISLIVWQVVRFVLGKEH